MRQRQNYSLYPRRTRRGRVVYYYRTCDEVGARTTGRSTGQSTKTAAHAYVQDLILARGAAPNQATDVRGLRPGLVDLGALSLYSQQIGMGRKDQPAVRRQPATMAGEILAAKVWQEGVGDNNLSRD